MPRLACWKTWGAATGAVWINNSDKGMQPTLCNSGWMELSCVLKVQRLSLSLSLSRHHSYSGIPSSLNALMPSHMRGEAKQMNHLPMAISSPIDHMNKMNGTWNTFVPVLVLMLSEKTDTSWRSIVIIYGGNCNCNFDDKKCYF